MSETFNEPLLCSSLYDIFDYKLCSSHPLNTAKMTVVYFSWIVYFYCKEISNPSAAICAKNIFVSAIMTNLFPAKIMFAEVVSMKNFPSNSPSGFHT